MPCLNKRGGRRPWHARIREYGRTVSLGSFETREEAVSREDEERRRYRAEVRRELPERAHWIRYAS